jgi:transposase
MEKVIEELRKENLELREILHQKDFENKELREKVQYLLQKLFGRKTEKIDPNQLLLLLQGVEASPPPPEDDDPPPSGPGGGPKKHSKRTPRKDKLPPDLPVETVVIEPKMVLENPEAYVRIGEDVLEELDITPTRYFKRRIVRPKYIKKAGRALPPVQAPAPKRLIENSFASVGLLVQILLGKYADHLPLYRQEQIFKIRYGIDLTRKTMADWVMKIANWLSGIYEEMKHELRNNQYLQVDETPIRYLNPGMGKCLRGFLWAYHAPGKGVLFEWHRGRRGECLENMLDSFRGHVQTDGLLVYPSYAKGRESLILVSCWAHARRLFFEARRDSHFAAWILYLIRHLYRVEKELRERKSGPSLRDALRNSESRMVLKRIGKALGMKKGAYRPQSPTGKAIDYVLKRWKELNVYLNEGHLEIDNNGVENAIRPTAIGKKNWMFFGSPESGQQSAVIYTILETCRKLGINSQEYLTDVLTRLPNLTNREIKNLTPSQWQEARRKQAA